MASKCLSDAMILLLGALCCADARLLRQEPVALSSAKGQQPAGTYAVTSENAEVGVASAAPGARYNAGTIQSAGDGAPGPLGVAISSDTMRRGNARSGNTATDANTVLGREVIAATYEGARAAAGTGVSYMADEGKGKAMSGNQAGFRPRHTHTRGSTAFTDVSGTSAAVAGEGNGPAALAFGLEVAAFSRSHRNKQPVMGPRDGFDAAGGN